MSDDLREVIGEIQQAEKGATRGILCLHDDILCTDGKWGTMTLECYTTLPHPDATARFRNNNDRELIIALWNSRHALLDAAERTEKAEAELEREKKGHREIAEALFGKVLELERVEAERDALRKPLRWLVGLHDGINREAYGLEVPKFPHECTSEWEQAYNCARNTLKQFVQDPEPSTDRISDTDKRLLAKGTLEILSERQEREQKGADDADQD